MDMSQEFEKKGIEVKDIIRNRDVSIEGLYLDLNLQELARKNNGKLVITNYITDTDDVIATKDENGEFQVAKELKNSSDWKLFNELSAQADLLFTGKDYLERVSKLGEKAQNILNPFDSNGAFKYLGDWRLENGFKSRNPDVAVLSRSLDFDVPKNLLLNDRKVYIFTTYESAKSKKAQDLINNGLKVIGAGDEGVDGSKMVDYLKDRGVYNVMKNTTGPRVFDILLKANAVDMIFITQVQKKISYSDTSDVQRVLVGGGKVEDLKGFSLYRKYRQDAATTGIGDTVTQEFRIYASNEFQKRL
jgi:riboflavin biosynthesis pyrimidine reductase